MWRVVVGATDLTRPGPETQVRHIKRLLVHQHYSNVTDSNDVALLELDQPVQCGYYVQLACVPDASLRVADLRTCYVSGWGATTARCEFLRHTRVPSASWELWAHQVHRGDGLGSAAAEVKAPAGLQVWLAIERWGRAVSQRQAGGTQLSKALKMQS